ncbi:MAG: hypothetical protein ACE5D8_05100 [Fidelibacterota bacterium]
MGTKIPIGTIDVAKYYNPSFEFAGPQPIQKQVTLDLPDGKQRTIKIDTINQHLVLEKDRVAVYSDLTFSQ